MNLDDEIKTFKRKHPEWEKGELRSIDVDIFHSLHFSDLDTKIGAFEPGASQSIFCANGISHPLRFWFDIFKKLSGIEAIIVFCIYQWAMTQEQTAEYLGVTQQYVNRIYNKAKKKLQLTAVGRTGG